MAFELISLADLKDIQVIFAEVQLGTSSETIATARAKFTAGSLGRESPGRRITAGLCAIMQQFFK